MITGFAIERRPPLAQFSATPVSCERLRPVRCEYIIRSSQPCCSRRPGRPRCARVVYANAPATSCRSHTDARAGLTGSAGRFRCLVICSEYAYTGYATTFLLQVQGKFGTSCVEGCIPEKVAILVRAASVAQPPSAGKAESPSSHPGRVCHARRSCPLELHFPAVQRLNRYRPSLTATCRSRSR